MNERKIGPLAWLLHRAFAFAIAAALTLAVFLVLPIMQRIGDPTRRDLMVRGVDVGHLPPPPPPPPEQEEPEEEPPDQPPELEPEAPPLDLSQLELALNPGMGEGLFGDFTIDLLQQIGGDEGGGDLDRIFSLAELDQRPRVLFQRVPHYPAELRRKNRQGTVYVVFLVDTDGRVIGPKVDKATDPAFERSALEAVSQWKFEPGTRNGEKVQFKMRVPITFNAT
jgi:protein TonB